MSDFEPLSSEQIAARGIGLHVKESPVTGEVRVRTTAFDLDVTVTNVPHGRGGWQNAHSHERVVEITTVLMGEVISVEMSPFGNPFFKLYSQGESFRTTPGRSHTLYVPGGTLLSTVKMYDSRPRDWIKDPELDKLVRRMSYKTARKRARVQS